MTASTATARNPQQMWQDDMNWVMREPYRGAVGNRDEVNRCPVWGDRLPWKSATVIVPAELEQHAAFCLACMHGGGYSRRGVLEDGRVALRSDYLAW